MVRARGGGGGERVFWPSYGSIGVMMDYVFVMQCEFVVVAFTSLVDLRGEPFFLEPSLFCCWVDAAFVDLGFWNERWTMIHASRWNIDFHIDW